MFLGYHVMLHICAELVHAVVQVRRSEETLGHQSLPSILLEEGSLLFVFHCVLWSRWPVRFRKISCLIYHLLVGVYRDYRSAVCGLLLHGFWGFQLGPSGLCIKHYHH